MTIDTPAGVQRRARFVRLVTIAMAASTMVCVVGFGRMIVEPRMSPAGTRPTRVATATATTATPLAAEALEGKRTARMALENGDAETALRAASRAIAIDPGDGEVWKLLAEASRATGNDQDVPKAAAQCRLIARLNVEACPSRDDRRTP